MNPAHSSLAAGSPERPPARPRPPSCGERPARSPPPSVPLFPPVPFDSGGAPFSAARAVCTAPLPLLGMPDYSAGWAALARLPATPALHKCPHCFLPPQLYAPFTVRRESLRPPPLWLLSRTLLFVSPLPCPTCRFAVLAFCNPSQPHLLQMQGTGGWVCESGAASRNERGAASSM